MMKLYGYFQSSAAFRVRIALHLKTLPYENATVDLLKGDHRTPEFERVNPEQAIPALVDGDKTLVQSLSIIEYLDEAYPEPPLLPSTPEGRARVRGLAQLVACDIHPLNNLRVLKYLSQKIGLNKDQRNAWYLHWIEEGFRAFEAMLSRSRETGTFCHGNQVTMADICLVPQVFNAKRYDLDLSPYPTLMRIFENLMKLTAFDTAQPSKQPDAR
jgi:maleylpyruvate isomerase